MANQTTISAALAAAKSIISPLESEVLLAHVLNVSRTYLHTWPEKKLAAVQEKDFQVLIAKRQAGEPIAYITGHREFWSLDLCVTPDVLIPRHETELLVELILEKIPPPAHSEPILIADLGTGSGAIALAIASARPDWFIHASDFSAAALKIAEMNAKRLKLLNVIFHQGKWCEALPDLKFHAIVSNPPYIAEDDDHLTQGDLRFEPATALVSAENGLNDLKQIIFQAKNYLQNNGLLLLEHGFLQAENVTSIFKKAGYTDINTYKDLAGCDRVTIASWRHF